MGLFDRIKSEVRNAGNAARGAIDEGKVRIDIFRVRQQADAAAQALGYAVHRARREGRELDASTVARLDGVLAAREGEASRLEAELARHRGEPPTAGAAHAPETPGSASGTGEAKPPGADAPAAPTAKPTDRAHG